MQTRRPAVLVAIADESTWENVESESELLNESVSGRRLLKVSGTVVIHEDDGVVRIRTRAESEESAIYKLSGRLKTIGPNGSEVWLGVPMITEYPTGDGGVVSSLDNANIRWKRTGGAWQRLSADCVGDVALRAVRDGQAIFQTHATIFPENFDYRIRPEGNNTGELGLIGLEQAKVIPSAQPNLSVESIRSGTRQILKVQTSSSQRPTSFPVRVVFASGGSSELNVSCPTTGIAIVDAAGQVVSPNLPIPLDRLDGLTLQATTADHESLLLVESGENRPLGDVAGNRFVESKGTIVVRYSELRSRLACPIR